MGITIDAHREPGQTDAQLINHWIARLADTQGGGHIALAAW